MKEFDRELDCNYCLLKLISLHNADNIKVRSKFSIWNCEGQKQYEIQRFTEFALNVEQKCHLNPDTINKVGQSLLLSHLLDDDEMTMCLDVDMELDDLAGKPIANLTDDLSNLFVYDNLSDVVLQRGRSEVPGSSCDPGGKVTRLSSHVHI